MKIGITGYRGRVGKEFLTYPNVVPLECDIRYPSDVAKAIQSTKPDLIVHLAAKRDVDFCEKIRNQDEVILTNVRGTYYVAEQAERYGIRMVLVSSDHVFSGKRWWGKYKENDKLDPVNFYGHTKMGAESLSLLFNKFKVVRTSTLFDDTRIAIERGRMGETSYPTFVKRSFIYLPHFVKLLNEYCCQFDQMPKILHLAGLDTVSYFEFMCDVKDFLNIDMNVRARKKEVEDFAPRGHNLGLDVSLALKLGFHGYSYLDGLVEMME